MTSLEDPIPKRPGSTTYRQQFTKDMYNSLYSDRGREGRKEANESLSTLLGHKFESYTGEYLEDIKSDRRSIMGSRTFRHKADPQIDERREWMRIYEETHDMSEAETLIFKALHDPLKKKRAKYIKLLTDKFSKASATDESTQKAKSLWRSIQSRNDRGKKVLLKDKRRNWYNLVGYLDETREPVSQSSEVASGVPNTIDGTISKVPENIRRDSVVDLNGSKESASALSELNTEPSEATVEEIIEDSKKIRDDVADPPSKAGSCTSGVAKSDSISIKSSRGVSQGTENTMKDGFENWSGKRANNPKEIISMNSRDHTSMASLPLPPSTISVGS